MLTYQIQRNATEVASTMEGILFIYSIKAFQQLAMHEIKIYFHKLTIHLFSFSLFLVMRFNLIQVKI